MKHFDVMGVEIMIGDFVKLPPFTYDCTEYIVIDLREHGYVGQIVNEMYSAVYRVVTQRLKIVSMRPLKGIPKMNTIKGRVLKAWRDKYGRVANHSQLKREYCNAARELGRRTPNPDYVSMNLLRILKQHGVKVGKPGTRTPWVLRREA